MNSTTKYKYFYVRLLSGLICLLMASFLSATSVSAKTIYGNVSLSGKQSSKAKRKDVVVYFEPEGASSKKLTSPLAEPFEVIMKNKKYIPHVSVIPSGSQLKISNRDSILHNAFSPSHSNQFDLGLYGKDKEKLHQLDTPGVVRIFCNVHYHMVAYVLVLDTPYYAITDDKGYYKLENLPNVPGKITFWHERARPIAKHINESSPEKLDVDIPITKRRIPAHKTKNGKSYKKKRRKRRY